MGKNEAYELEVFLRDIETAGFGSIHLKKLLRILEKGNRAAGTWKSLLDAWEEIGQTRSNLFIAELPGETILVTSIRPDSAKLWANE
ncbi:hypothetical protein [Mesorhizobium sp.]|uniref:hypothetical protein n=1 Tax=Mesorhizobium sp. TaxID=1871066 RepID=UPI000FE4E01B|nr:hypothetical protein [Mesorhizobium sp.]RWP36290.1 MAG: hypothetical protein EOR03_09980 [Mesorhizobium sp.]